MKKDLSILITSLSGGGAERVVSVLLNELKNEYNITLVLFPSFPSFPMSTLGMYTRSKNKIKAKKRAFKILCQPKVLDI